MNHWVKAACLCTGALLLLAVGPTKDARADFGFRCGTRVVSVGETTGQVVRRCGDPDFASQRREYRTIAVRQGSVYVERVVEIIIDEWEYDLGPNRFVRYLYFENGRLLNVTTGERGRKDDAQSTP